MKYYENIKEIKSENGVVHIDVPDRFYELEDCKEFFRKLMFIRFEELISKFRTETNILVINLPLYPNYETLSNYNLRGINTILFYLMSGLGKKYQEELLNSNNIILNVSVSEDEFYTFPVLNLQLLIEGTFSENFRNRLMNKLTSDLLMYLGGCGDVEYYENFKSEEIRDMFLYFPQKFYLFHNLIENLIDFNDGIVHLLSYGVCSLTPQNLLSNDIPIDEFYKIRECVISQMGRELTKKDTGFDMEGLNFE
jgi:hypothetical protein